MPAVPPNPDETRVRRLPRRLPRRLADSPGSIKLEMIDGAVHVWAHDSDQVELAHLVGGTLMDKIREAVAAIDPVLAVEIGADPHELLRRVCEG